MDVRTEEQIKDKTVMEFAGNRGGKESWWWIDEDLEGEAFVFENKAEDNDEQDIPPKGLTWYQGIEQPCFSGDNVLLAFDEKTKYGYLMFDSYISKSGKTYPCKEVWFVLACLMPEPLTVDDL